MQGLGPDALYPARPQRIPWREIVLIAAAVWLAMRVGYAVFTYLDLVYYQPAPVSGCTFDPHCSGKGPLTNWFRFDGAWYVNIARDGYFSREAAAFFPLYPTLIRLALTVTGTRYEVVDALLIANLAALLAMVALAALAHSESWSGGPYAAALAAAAYPFAFFTATPYTEPLFLALAAFSLLLARRGRPLAAAALALLATLTRSTGFVLLLPLLWEAGRTTGLWDAIASRTPLRLSRRAVLALGATVAAVPLSLAAFSVYLKVFAGDALLWQHAQAAWGRSLTAPWVTLFLQLRHLRSAPPYSPLQASILLDTAPLVLFAVLTILAARRLPFSMLLYQAGLIGLILMTPEPAHDNVLPSAGRFLVASVPIFLLLGGWIDRHRWMGAIWLTAGLLTQAVLLAQFMAWTPIGA